MALLTDKEEEYIDLRVLIGDDQQRHVDGINPTYNITDWLKARNICRGDPELMNIDPSGHTIDFEKEIYSLGSDEMGVKLRTYVESVLTARDIEVKGERGPINQTFS